jgi:1,4-alpha-glucan branching enzyme
MIHKTPSNRPGYFYIVFELPSCIWADQIAVTGDFNQWDRSALPMKQGRDGVWRACLELAAGKVYAFRYVVDGRWQTDHHADGTVDNGPWGRTTAFSTLRWPLRLAQNTG